MAYTISFSNQNFQVIRVNGKYAWLQVAKRFPRVSTHNIYAF